MVSTAEVAIQQEPLSDEEVVARVLAGETAMFEIVMRRYNQRLYRTARAILRDDGEAEDVMQEIFVQVWRNPGAFVSGKGSLAGWLAVVARNRAIDVIRRRHPAEPVELFALPASTNLASEAERDSLLEKIRGVMGSLPQEQRRPLELAFFEGLSHSEIAAQTGDPLGTVKTRIRIALTTIRKALTV